MRGWGLKKRGVLRPVPVLKSKKVRPAKAQGAIVTTDVSRYNNSPLGRRPRLISRVSVDPTGGYWRLEHAAVSHLPAAAPATCLGSRSSTLCAENGRRAPAAVAHATRRGLRIRNTCCFRRGRSVHNHVKVCSITKLDIGFVVLKQDAKDRAGRKTTTKVRKAELVYKTKWRTTDVATAEVDLPTPDQGRRFIILPCTFEPGHEATFELQVVSPDGADFSLMPIGDEPPLPLLEKAANGAVAPPAPAAVASNPFPRPSPGATASAVAATGGASTDSSGRVAENEVIVASEGQGLSAKQRLEASELVQKALSAAGESADGLFTDADFPAEPKSLWINGSSPGEALQQAGVTADLVQSWRRPSDFAPPLAESEGAPRLFYSDYALQGVVASPLLNHWLLAACNIVGGDVDILERVFVDTEHADKGFYVVRFYVDDPASDDDWKVVLVDDQLPCGEDGLPCFARCPSPVVLWVSIIEKAFAKLQGCYEATGGGSVEDGLLYLTGGLSREVGIAPSADPTMVDKLWQQMMEWWMSAHVIGCEHRIDSEPSPELQTTGLLPNTPYCVVTGGEPMGAGRMVRLRTFHGYSEWKGKWSDDDPAWTSRLRQSLAFSNNTDDGTFWMSFDDFVTWFNVLFTCRMADDRWTTLSTRSRWQDETAGGCPPNFATWRNNPQWLLRTSQPVQLTVTLSVPQPPPPADGANAPVFTPDAAIGISVITGNLGADARRRKLQVTSADELIVRAEPRPVRRLVTQITLEASDTPYLLIPHTYLPGKESPFTMTVRADDVNDDGIADFSLEPVRPETDWYHKSQMEAWDVALARGKGACRGRRRRLRRGGERRRRGRRGGHRTNGSQRRRTLRGWRRRAAGNAGLHG